MPEIRDKFSVVVPVLNAKDFLHRSLDSILAAMDRYGNAELVVLDNGSTDGSYEILLQERPPGKDPADSGSHGGEFA